jgi:hypothetical protein
MLMAPVEAYLAEHPDDWGGAYDVMLGSISGGEADLTDSKVAAMRRQRGGGGTRRRPGHYLAPA